MLARFELQLAVKSAASTLCQSRCGFEFVPWLGLTFTQAHIHTFYWYQKRAHIDWVQCNKCDRYFIRLQFLQHIFHTQLDCWRPNTLTHSAKRNEFRAILCSAASDLNGMDSRSAVSLEFTFTTSKEQGCAQAHTHTHFNMVKIVQNI